MKCANSGAQIGQSPTKKLKKWSNNSKCDQLLVDVWKS